MNALVIGILYASVPGYPERAVHADSLGAWTAYLVVHGEEQRVREICGILEAVPLVMRHAEHEDVFMAMSCPRAGVVSLHMWNARSGTGRVGHTPPRGDLTRWAHKVCAALGWHEVVPDAPFTGWEHMIESGYVNLYTDPPYDRALVDAWIRDQTDAPKP